MNDYDITKGFLGTGFKFPVQVDETTGRMMTVSYEDDIKEAIGIILGTKRGERIMTPDFGCGISEYAFGSTDFTTMSLLCKDVKKSLTMWEPRIKDIDVSVDTSEINEGKVIINIAYTVRTTNNPFNLVFPYYISEGYGINAE